MTEVKTKIETPSQDLWVLNLIPAVLYAMA